MSECSVCFNDMDMEEYDDPNESTRTCVRLDCKHAYHTKCVLKCMKETNFECILCNKHRNPVEEMGLVVQALAEAKGDKKFRELKKEYDHLGSEFLKCSRQLKKETQEFIKRRGRELDIFSKRHDVLVAHSKIIRYAKKYALKTPILAGSMMPNLDGFNTDKFLGLKPKWKYKRSYFYYRFVCGK